MKNILAILTFLGVVGWLFYNEFETQSLKAEKIKQHHNVKNQKQLKELERDVSSIKLED